MRRLIPLLAVAACASAGAPPGGPERHEPPTLTRVTPDSGATDVRAREADFQFDEVVSEKPTKGELDQVFVISPRDGAPRIAWHRTHISVRPRNGFKPNTAYTVTMLPGISDLRGNVTKQGKQILFSTGPTIPRLGIVGRVFDWAAEAAAVNAIVEAVRLPDSTVFITTSDSSGQFDVGPFGPGTYTVRGYIDQNSNFIIDKTEKWDSVTVTVADVRPTVELLLIVRDSTPPLMTNVTMLDTVTLQLTFDRPLAVSPAGGYGKFHVTRSDSVAVAIVRVLTPMQYTKLRDSLTAAADTTKRPQPPAAQPSAVPPPANPPSAVAGIPGVGAKKPPAPIKPSVPPPPSSLYLLLSGDTPLQRGRSYRVTATDVPGLTGTSGKGNRVLTVPKADTTKKAPADSAARARADSTRRPAIRPGRPPLR